MKSHPYSPWTSGPNTQKGIKYYQQEQLDAQIIIKNSASHSIFQILNYVAGTPKFWAY